VNRKLVFLALLLALGVAHAAEKVQKDQGTARARFAWEKMDGALDTARLGRTVEGSGVGTIEVDSGGTAVWIDFDPEKTSSDSILKRLKETRAYEAAKLTSTVSIFKGPFGVVTATAWVKGSAKAPKRRGELMVRVEAASGFAIDMDPKGKHGNFKAGVSVTKPPRDVELDKAGKAGHAGAAETYSQGLALKKGGEDSVLSVTVNVAVKDAKGKEELHAIELPVPVQAQE
jgi:hypothetical protein